MVCGWVWAAGRSPAMPAQQWQSAADRWALHDQLCASTRAALSEWPTLTKRTLLQYHSMFTCVHLPPSVQVKVAAHHCLTAALVVLHLLQGLIRRPSGAAGHLPLLRGQAPGTLCLAWAASACAAAAARQRGWHQSVSGGSTLGAPSESLLLCTCTNVVMDECVAE